MADIQTTQQQIQNRQPQTPKVATTEVSAKKIHVTVRNRTQILFNDDVKSLTSKNDTGIFDILPEHANFISLVGGSLILRKLDGQKQEIPLQNGFIKVKDNTIFCYIDLISNEANLKPNPVVQNNKK